MQVFKSFGELAEHVHKQDVRRAQNLKRSRPIANLAPGTGPRVAR